MVQNTSWVPRPIEVVSENVFLFFFKKSKGILDVFVYYCCITNYHKLSGLIQHPFMNSHFCRLEGWHSMNGLSAEGIIKLKSNVDWTEFSSGWGSGEKSTSRLILVVAVVGLRSLFCCVLLVKITLTSYTPLSGPSHMTPVVSSHHGCLLSSRPDGAHLSDFLLCYQLEKNLCFYRPHRLGQAHPDNLLILKSTLPYKHNTIRGLIAHHIHSPRACTQSWVWGEDHGRDLRILPATGYKPKDKKYFGKCRVIDCIVWGTKHDLGVWRYKFKL